MPFGTKRVYITGQAKRIAPSGHSVNVAPASIGTKDISDLNKTVTVTASAAAGAAKAAAFDSLLNTQVVSALDTLIGTTIGIDTTGNTVDYNFKVTEITRGSNDDDIFLSDANVSYQVTGILEVAVS